MRSAKLVLALACAVIVGMYCTNEDNDRKPDAPRGEGRYLPVLARGDGHMMFLMARSTALDLDWDFKNDLRRFGDPWQQPINKVTHRKEIPHPVGPPLLWTPLIWIAHAGATVANLFGAAIPTHGYTEWYQRFVFLSSVAAALFAVLLGWRVARTMIGGVWSPTYAAVAVLLGTSITYYATYMPSYGHALDAGACAAFLGYWALTLGRTDWKRWLVLGGLLGVAMLIRVQDVAFGVVVALEVAVASIQELRTPERDWRRVGRWVAGGAVVLAVSLVLLAPQFYYWHLVYGSWTSLPQGEHYTRLGAPMIMELLYSARNGWFSTTPVAYLAVLGLLCVPRKARLVAGGFALAVAMQVYLNSTILDWWGMASWGQRRLCSVTIVLVFGLAALLWRCGRLVARLRRVHRFVWHVPAVLVLAPMIWWNLWRISKLDGGLAAPTDHAPTCCETAHERLRKPLRWIYNRIGNPFQLPASLLFALRHEVEIQRWDQAVGNYPLMPSTQSLRDDSMFLESGAWRIGYPLAEPYLMGWWSGPRTAFEKSFRWTLSPVVRALVPNLMPHPQRLTLWVAPGGSNFVRIRWDDEIVVEQTLHPGWQQVEWIVRDMSVGEHELTIEAMPLPFWPQAGWPRPRLPVGIAVNALHVHFVRD